MLGFEYHIWEKNRFRVWQQLMYMILIGKNKALTETAREGVVIIRGPC